MTTTETRHMVPLPRPLQLREDLSALAYRKMRFPNMSVDDDLDRLTALDADGTHTWFCELIEAIRERDGLADGSLSWVDTMSDATGYDRDGQASESALARVELALDALLGGVS